MDIHKAASIMGKQRSARKAQAVRENGKGGGRPAQDLGKRAGKKNPTAGKNGVRKKTV